MKQKQAEQKETVLLTGASSGIGLELAHLFARDGYRLILVARSGQKLEELAENLRKSFQSDVKILPMDLSYMHAGEQLYQKIRDEGLRVDILVNNAGVGLHGPFLTKSLPKIQQMVQLNIQTLTDLSRLFLPAMIERKRGRILNVASTAAFQPGPLMAVYYASKAYVLHFSEALREEVKDGGVTVSVLCPGPTHTQFQKSAEMGPVPVFTYAGMEAGVVARAGYRGCIKGKPIIIPGLLNKIMVFSVRLAPRALVVKIARLLQQERSKE